MSLVATELVLRARQMRVMFEGSVTLVWEKMPGRRSPRALEVGASE